MAGTLSPAAVSPYVLAGDGSWTDSFLTREADAIFSREGTATLEYLRSPSMDLSGVAGGCDVDMMGASSVDLASAEDKSEDKKLKE